MSCKVSLLFTPVILSDYQEDATYSRGHTEEMSDRPVVPAFSRASKDNIDVNDISSHNRNFVCYLLNLEWHRHQGALGELGIQSSTSTAVKLMQPSWLNPNDILASEQTTLSTPWHRTANKSLGLFHWFSNLELIPLKVLRPWQGSDPRISSSRSAPVELQGRVG